MSLARAFALLMPIRWSAIPDDVGAEYWRRGLAEGHVASLVKGERRIEYLAKAKTSHRYIKRVATGNPRRPWRYFYNDAAVAHEHAVGDRLNTKSGGKLDVVHVADGKVHVQDERGQRHELDAHELHARMFGAHVEAAERLATKTAADWAKARGEAKGTPGEALHAALKAAGMPHDAASSLARFVESRPGWTETARRTMADAVAHSGRKPSTVAANLRQVANAAENLRTVRNTKRVTPAHVAEAVELRLPKGKEADNFLAAWGDLRDKLGKANARAEGLITALEHVGPEHKGLAEKAKAAVADAAHHEARTMAQAFPALRNDPELAHADELAARLTAVLAQAKAPSTIGATTTFYIANKDGAPEPRQARYRVMEAEDVRASHLPGESFHVNKAYPEGVQERLYHSDSAEQDKVRANATSFRPDIVHNTNPDAVNGPPLITEDGVVLGGNSRTMSMQLVHGTSKSQALKDHLVANAYQFGLTKEAVEGMKHPILVRELVGVDAKTTPKDDLKDLVRRANESFTQGMDPRAMQVALAKRVDDNMLEKLGKMDPEETLSDFLSKPASRDFVRSMQHSGIIDRRNRSQYLRDDGMLNQDGKQFVERLLVGKMIPDADLLGDVSLQHMAALSRAAPAILAAKTNGKTHDLTEDLAVALRTQRDMDVRQHKTLGEYFSQDEMDFATGKAAIKPIQGNDRAILLHKILTDHGKSPAVVAKMFRTYAKSAAKEHDTQGGLFGSAPSSLSTLRASVEAHKPKKEEAAGTTGDLFGKGGATVYTGPKGGKYSDPEHKHHWTPTAHGLQADWVGSESAAKRAARKEKVDKAMGAWSAAAARMKASPGDRSAFQGHHDALHGLAHALNLQTGEGERPADAAAKWLKSNGHKVPARRSGHKREPVAVQESLFRGRPLARAIYKALTEPRSGGLLELPEAYGERLWALAKGAGHKYLKRVPKAGGGYRYYYRVGHGGGIDSHEHMVEGASFRHNGGHWQIKKTDGDTLHIEHDESGESKKVTRAELAGMLQGEHGKALEAHREGIRSQLAEARKNKASPKQIARLEERAKRAGGAEKPADAMKAHEQAKARQTEAAMEHKRLSKEFDATPRAKRTREMSEKLDAAWRAKRDADEAEEKAYGAAYGAKHSEGAGEPPSAAPQKLSAQDVYDLVPMAHRYGIGGLMGLSEKRIGDMMDGIKSAELRGDELDAAKELVNKIRSRATAHPTERAFADALAAHVGMGAGNGTEAKPKTTEPSAFNPEEAVKIAADSTSALRRQDIHRVLESTPKHHRRAVADHITRKRPEHAGEVRDAMADLGEQPMSGEDHIGKVAADAHALAKERGERVYVSATKAEPETGKGAQFHIRTDAQAHPHNAQFVSGQAIRGDEDLADVHARIKGNMRGTNLGPMHETPITTRNTAEHTAEIVAERAREDEEQAAREAKRAAERKSERLASQSRADYIRSEIDKTRAQRAARLREAEQAIEATGIKRPVGITAVHALMAKRNPTKEERGLLTAYRVAKQNHEANLSGDEETHGKVWDRRNGVAVKDARDDFSFKGSRLSSAFRKAIAAWKAA